MKIFIAILFVALAVLVILVLFLDVRISALTKQRKEDVLNSLNEHDKNVVRDYIEACHVSVKDCFTFKKRGKK